MGARTLALAAIAALAMFWTVVLFATWNEPHALFGWNLGSDGESLVYITPGGPAQKAGLRVGDRIEWATLPLRGRANLGIVEAVPPSTRLPVTIRRGSARETVMLAPLRWPLVFEIASRTLTLGGLFLMFVGIALVQLRPSRMTWGFLLSALPLAFPDAISWQWAQSAPWRFALADGTLSLLWGAYAAGILIFMSRFPSDRPRGLLVAFDRIAVPLGVAVALFGLLIDAGILFSAHPPPAWALFMNRSLIQVLLFALALSALTTAYATTSSSDRHRIVPVLIAFACGVVLTAVHNLYSAYFTNPYVTATQYFLIALSMAALAIAVANGIIRHRVFDVSFVISRTVVYTVLTSLIVGAFVLIDFVSSKVLDRLQIAIVLEAATALAFGIWLNALHSRIDHFVDRVLFRRRHLAESRLQRAARGLPHAENAEYIDDALVTEACDALSLASAAVFRRSGSDRFQRVLSRGWSDAHLAEIQRSDRLVVRLMAELEVADLADVRWAHLDIPAGIEQPLLAIPFVVRHDVFGFVLYGGHVGGEAIDPDEKRLLAQLSEAAASAYDHVESKALAGQVKELRAENAMLLREERLLRETIDALRSVTGRVENQPS